MAVRINAPQYCCSPICSYCGPVTGGERALVRLPKNSSNDVLKYLKCSPNFIAEHVITSKLYACTCHFETVVRKANASAVLVFFDSESNRRANDPTYQVVKKAKASAFFVFFVSESDRRANDPTYQVGCKWFRNDVDPSNQQKRKSIDSSDQRCENRNQLRLKEKYQEQDPVELGKQIQDYQIRFRMNIFS